MSHAIWASILNSFMLQKQYFQWIKPSSLFRFSKIEHHRFIIIQLRWDQNAQNLSHLNGYWSYFIFNELPME